MLNDGFCGLIWYIRYVKHSIVFSLVVSALLLGACESDGTLYQSDVQRVQKNHMDLPDPIRCYFNGIQYELSSMFHPHYDDSYVLGDLYEIRVNYGLHMYFSIESFSESEAEEIQFMFENGDEMTLLDAVHDHYAIKRNESLEEATVSIKKNVPKSVKYPGVMQVISGSTYSEAVPNSYFFATLEINDQIVVVQLIGKKENMGYMHDDFIDILSSIVA